MIKNRGGLFRNCGLFSECHALISYLMSNMCVCVCAFFQDQMWSSCLSSIHLYLLMFGFWSLKLINVLGLGGLCCIHARPQVLYFQLGLPLMLCCLLLNPTESIAYSKMIAQKKKNIFQNVKIRNQRVSVYLQNIM